MSSIVCIKCGAKNDQSARFCGQCGEKLAVIQLIPVSSVIRKRYKVEAILRQGPYSAVVKALDGNRGREVALKEVLLPETGPAAIESTIQGFKAKAGLLFHMSHPSLARVTDFFVESGKCYIVMDFIHGQDLQTIIDERNYTPLPQSQVLKWLIRILDALDYLHSHTPQLLFQDLKPSHIMISARGPVFLVDFGVSDYFKSLKSGGLFGTPGFAAPEQYKGFSDHRSDIYSLGAILHYLLSGINPASPNRPPFLFQGIRDVNPHVSSSFEKLIMSMLQMKIDDRPASVRQIIASLNSLGRDSGRSPDMFKRGIARYNQGEFESAIKSFKQSILLDPENVKAYLWRGMCNEGLGNVDSAIKDYTNALEIDFNYISALCKRGGVFLLQGENDKALLDFSRAVELDPNYAEAFKGRGLVYKEIGKFQEAIRDFDMALKIDQNYDEALLWRGLTYYTVGEFVLAIEDFDRAIEIRPEFEDAYMGRALAYDGLGRFDICIQDNTLAIEINPGSPSAYYGRGAAYRRMGMPSLALEDLDRAISLDPEYPDAYFERGLVQYEIGLVEDSIGDFTRAIEFDPQYAEAYKYRGKAYSRERNHKKAKEDLLKYEEITKNIGIY